MYVDEESLKSFMTEVAIIQKPVRRFAEKIKWTGFYTTKTSIMKELMVCYLHVFIEIFLIENHNSLIMTK